MFTIVVTIPAALVTGFWMYKIRPGRVGEASIIGMILVFLGVVLGKPFDDSKLRDSVCSSMRCNCRSCCRSTRPRGLDPAGLGVCFALEATSART